MMKETTLTLALIFVFLLLIKGVRAAETVQNETLQNRTKMKLPFLSGLKLLYEAKKNESLSEDNIKALNEQLEEQGAKKFMQGLGPTNLTFEARNENGTYFIVSIRIKNGSIKDVFFGEYPKAGENMKNLYFSINTDFVRNLLEKWEKKTQGGKKEPGAGLILSTVFDILKGILKGKLKVKPFWAILRLGKILKMGSAIKSSKVTTAIVLS